MKNYILIFFVCLCYFNSILSAQESSIQTEKTDPSATQGFAIDQTNTIPASPSDPLIHPTTPSRHEYSTNDPFLRDPIPQPEGDNFQSKFINMLFLLGLLIAFMMLASWMIKRLMKSRLEQMNTTSTIKVLETRQLSPRSAVHVLDIMGKGIVVAESAAGVHYLTTIPLDEVTDYEEDNHESERSKR